MTCSLGIGQLIISFSFVSKAGLNAGVIGTIIGFPFDLVKTRMQTGSTRKTSIFKIGRTIVKKEGMLALYKGLWPPLISISILTTITFPQYTFWRQLYGAKPGWDYRNSLAGITCGPIGGIFSTVENFVKVSPPRFRDCFCGSIGTLYSHLIMCLDY